MTDPNVDVIEKTTVFSGYFQVDRYRLRHRLHDGGWSDELVREMFERGHAVAVLPYDPATDVVVLIEQFRLGAFAAGLHPWQIEAVAGMIEVGETPEDLARREAAEEAGLEILDLIPALTFLNSSGAMSQTTATFIGRVDASGAGGVFGLDDEGEDILVRPMPLSNAMDLLNWGRIPDAQTVVCLQWLALNRDRVRADWGA